MSVTDFTYVRSWAGFVYLAFIVDVFAQRIVAWHAATTKLTLTCEALGYRLFHQSAKQPPK